MDMRKVRRTTDDTEQVDDFMINLDHPFKAELQRVREIIKDVDRDITEQIKWRAPSFSYRGKYLMTFNLWEKKRIHLVFHNPVIPRVKSKLLEGNYKDRRMMYFVDVNDIEKKKSSLEKVLKDMIRLIDK